MAKTHLCRILSFVVSVQSFDMLADDQFGVYFPTSNLGSALSWLIWGQSDRRSEGRFKPFDLTLEIPCASIEVCTLPLGFSILISGGHLVLDASFGAA